MVLENDQNPPFQEEEEGVGKLVGLGETRCKLNYYLILASGTPEWVEWPEC